MYTDPIDESGWQEAVNHAQAAIEFADHQENSPTPRRTRVDVARCYELVLKGAEQGLSPDRPAVSRLFLELVSQHSRVSEQPAEGFSVRKGATVREITFSPNHSRRGTAGRSY